MEKVRLKNDRTFLAYYGPWKTSVRIRRIKTCQKQIEALNLLLTQDLEKGNNEISSAIWSALKCKDYVEEIIVPTEQKKLAASSRG